MPRIAARARSSLMMASAGISHMVVSVQGPAKRSSYWPSRRVSSYSGRRKLREPLHEVRARKSAACRKRCCPRARSARSWRASRCARGRAGRSARARRRSRRAGSTSVRLMSWKVTRRSRMHLPDHLQHQELVEIRVEQRPDRGVDPERVIIDAGCDVRGHCATLGRPTGRATRARRACEGRIAK